MSSEPAPDRTASTAHATSELRYRRLFEAAKDGILILDADTGRIVDANPFLLKLLGFTLEEVVGEPVWNLGFLSDIVSNRAKYEELRLIEYIRYDDKALKTRDGQRVEVEFVSNVYREGEHRVIQCNIRDIRSRRRAEEALYASRQIADAIMDALPVRVFWKDLDLVYMGCNTAFAHDAGFADPADVIGRDDQQMPWAAQAASYRADDRDVITSGEPKLLIEEPQTTLHGETITLLTSKVPLRDESGKIMGVLGTYLDITSLKQAEASAARLAMAVQQTDEAILITDASATILDVNPAFLRTSGYTREEVVGQNPRLLKSGNHDSSFYQQMWSTLGSGQVWRGRLTNKRKDGTLYEEDATISPMVDAAGKIVSFVGVKRDVTEKERMAAQMRRIQRLESVGSLAAGIAHDLNNALTPVLIVGELLRMEFPDRASADLDVIQAGARRGADLVKHLMNFARGAEGERLPVQLKPLCTELRQIFQSTFPKNIELQLDCPKDLPDILGDATQLHQVFLNLMVNARDAMPDGGKISITARPTDLGDPEVSFLPLQPGRYVLVRVGDTGSGIPPEALDRIFDPFFTTKGPDAGTGLGLSTSLGIVKGHGGYIRAYSIPGHGSTLSVYLPAHDADIGDTASRRGSTPAFRGQGETILVVDDEPAVRDILRRLLTKLNFKVVTAGEATSALKEVSELGTELAAVITDLHMPQLSGLSFVRVLRGRWPTTGVIVVSGLMTPQERDEFAKLGVHAVLDKPFMESDLVKALRTIFVG